MLSSHLSSATCTQKMKIKRDLKSPRRNRTLAVNRPLTRKSNVKTGCANIQVVVRVRPHNDREQGDHLSTVIKVVDGQTLIFDPEEEYEPFFYHGVQQRNRDIMKKANKNLHFTFDKVFSSEATNLGVFEASTKTLIDSLMNGYNCSVFVYGATGAGKTHTMLGSAKDPGITFLTMNELFQRKEALSEERQFEIGMTYLEVYNENVQDLLKPGPPLHLREDGKFGVIVAGIQVHKIDKSERLFELLEEGNRNRTQHPTDANAESSRSHAVFQVYLRMKFITSEELRVAKLSMIDLAGSERGAATGFSGARFAEGANINKSLLALGNCINGLADGHSHIPYRDSKLTRLLKDSLGGNCQTIMITNVSPSSLSYEDTYNTLKYATRAKKIKSNMKKNVINCERNFNHYVKLVEELTQENEKLKLQLSISTNSTCTCKNNPESTNEDQVTKVTIAIGPEPQIKDDLLILYKQRKELEERQLHLESVHQLNLLRIQLKEDSDSRLSGICSDTPDKELGHRRLGVAIDKLDGRNADIQKDISRVKDSIAEVDKKIEQFKQEHPHLRTVAEMQEIEILRIRDKNKAEHLQKICDIQNGELRMRSQLNERYSKVLKPCYLQLRGHGLATDSLTASYNGLVKHVQGIRSVTWDAELSATDSGVGTTNEDEEEKRGEKRKHSEDPNVNTTFVLEEEKRRPTDKLMSKEIGGGEPHVASGSKTRIFAEKQPTITAQRLMTKLYKTASKTSHKIYSPSELKENQPLFHGRARPNFKKPHKVLSSSDKMKSKPLRSKSAGILPNAISKK